MNHKFSHDVFISFSFKDQALADKIVNQLMNKYQIPCWICTEQIRAGDYYYDDIADAISASKIFVFVQTKNSVESTEIPDEVLTAIDEGKTIISFIVEDSELRGQMKLKLKHRQHIDARKPELDDRIEDLAKELCLLLNRPFGSQCVSSQKVERPIKLLATPNVIPKTIFCGRDDVLSEIHTKYQEGERVLFLYGIGGIGKTQIAKQYAKQHKNDYDTIIYTTYNGSLRKMIVSDSPFAIEPELIRYTLSDGTQEDDNAFFDRKLKLINKLSNERTLIIIDNFDVKKDEDLPLLMNGKHHLLITTRCDYSRFYPTIKINPINSVESLKDIFMENYQGDDVKRDDLKLVELIELVSRHTYTIELLAQHMGNSGQTPTEMIAALKEQGITSLNEEVCNSDMKTQIAYENLLKMFKIFSLSEEERRILMHLSLMPIEGVSTRDFKEWANLSSSREINNLESKSWIIRNTNGIALHPIIRAVINHELPATEETCKEFINRFSNTIEELKSWHLKKEDKDKYGAIAKLLLSTFKKITKETEALYYNSETLLSFAVDPQYAAELAERLYTYYTANYNYYSYEVGRAAFKLGWLYAYNTHLPNAINLALDWLTKADQILSQIQLRTTTEISKLTQTKVNLAKIHLILFKQTQKKEIYLIAKEYAEFNIEYSLKSYKQGDPQYAKLAGAYWQLADVLLAGEEHEKALENIDKALDILIPLNTQNNGDSMHATSRKAAILYAMGKYKDAKEFAQKGVIGYVDYFGENHPTVVEMYTLLGNCCLALNEHTEAKTVYEKALKISEKLYAPSSTQILDLQAKIRQ